tara:strand:+ start:228 stop:398 length:171 start_codon:yes stop_codon:yes gene_type:complete
VSPVTARTLRLSEADAFFKFSDAVLSFQNVSDLPETEDTDAENEQAEQDPEKQRVD